MGGVKSGRSVPAVVLAILPAAGMSLAHQPRLVGDRPSIEVRDPEVSQAFYARLAGEPQTYRIPSEVPFRLYVNLLVPDLPGIETDYVAVVFREEDGGGDRPRGQAPPPRAAWGGRSHHGETMIDAISGAHNLSRLGGDRFRPAYLAGA